MDLQFGDYRLMHRDRQVSGPDGPLNLSARSFDILAALLAKPNELISKNDLFDTVWPGVAVEENTLQVHVSGLRKALGPSLIVTVHGRGYKYAGPPPVSPGGHEPAQVKPDRKPLVAVLPFNNPGDDPEQQYFIDGITEDIIDRLAKYRVLSVIGHHSSFALRGRDDDLPELRGKLAADYVLTGSIRKLGGRVRIAARLTDAVNGTAMWAEHYDRPLEDVFAVQDEVADIIASTLMGRVELEIGGRGPQRGLDVSSYELVLRGIWHFRTLTVAGNAYAAECFQAAIAVNPGNAYAHRWLSSCYINHWFMEHRRDHLAKGLELARRSTELDPTNAQCHTACAFLQLWAEGLDAATASYNKAFALTPGDPHVLAELGLLHIYRGDLASAYDFIDQAERLNPLPPLWYAEFRAIGAFVAGRYAEALPGFAAIPECAFDTAYVTACLGHLGDAAGIAAITPRIEQRHWDLLAVAADEPFRDPEPRQRLITGIAKAFALSNG